MNFYIDSDGNIYTGDMQAGDRLATKEEIEAHFNPPKTFAEAKTAKLWEINSACDDILNAAVFDYPASEIQTFSQQSSEAAAYKDNPEYIPPLLSMLAQARGIELPELVDRVLAKHMAFSAIGGLVIGQRQALEDRLNLCETVEDIAEIEVKIAVSV